MAVKLMSATSPGDLGGPQSPTDKPTRTPNKMKNGKELDFSQDSNGAAFESTVVTDKMLPTTKQQNIRCAIRQDSG
jgi:hypothetical protein